MPNEKFSLFWCHHYSRGTSLVTNNSTNMNFTEGNLYHIYNRGNNKQSIFFTEHNYYYFIKKIHDYVKSTSELLAYCLMPNHFHILIMANEKTIEIPERKKISGNQLSENLRIMLSSYTRAINKQENRTGSLFTQNTKAKAVTDWRSNMNYGEICFNYIHKNPLSSNLVKSLENWPYSSYYEYTGKIANPICNVDLGKNLFDIRWTKYIENIKSEKIEKEALKLIF